LRLLYFSRDYTPHDHRFLSALVQRARQSGEQGVPFPVDKLYFMRLERRNPQLEDRPLPPEVEQVSWAGGRQGLANHGLAAGNWSLWRQALRLLPSLKRVISTFKPDLIVAGPIQRSAFLVALAGFPRLVSMSWGYDLLIDAERSPLWRWATLFTLKRSAALVGDCETIRRRAAAFGMPEERVVTFPWGVDLRHFQPAPSLANEAQPAERSVFTLLSTRSWEPIYGIDLLARAFVTAAHACPNLRLMMLADGSLAGELRRIFAQGGVEDRVSFAGQVGYTSLPRYYRMADLYLSASHSDGSSISLLEAMACGRPALVSDIPGNREWVKEGENGWLFPDGDAEALAQAIVAAVENRCQLPAMGRFARQVAEQRADWEKNFPQLFRAFQIACQGSSANGQEG